MTTPDPRILEECNGVTFLDCLKTCLHTPEFVAQWERLEGRKLVAASPIERMIDEATGYNVATMREFADFVYQYVYLTL